MIPELDNKGRTRKEWQAECRRSNFEYSLICLREKYADLTGEQMEMIVKSVFNLHPTAEQYNGLAEKQ